MRVHKFRDTAAVAIIVLKEMPELYLYILKYILNNLKNIYKILKPEGNIH